ncbi:hypothetical protein [Botrimarina sp.]|uniref:hypothetical protein n=1 Tax=Botrimarina sp. TaxID=2795802 RepID=UPI0032ECD27E
METSLHRELKALYAGDDGQVEVRLGRYRIDVVRGDLLIEVQHAGLSSIRDKVRRLCGEAPVLVVKPVVARRRLVTRDKPGGRVKSRRWSPKRGRLVDLFHDFVHFTKAFPHERLAVEAPLVEVEEHRVPGHGRRRRWRRRDHVVVDQKLLGVLSTVRFETAADLWRLVEGPLPLEFDTAELATALDTPRWVAQRAAYCLHAMGAAERVGKRRGAWLYQRRASSLADAA